MQIWERLTQSRHSVQSFQWNRGSTDTESDVHAEIKNCLSSQTGCNCLDFSLQKAKILDKTLQKVKQAMCLSNWTELTETVLKKCFYRI